MPHGNAKNKTSARPFKRTMPSVLNYFRAHINTHPNDKHNAKNVHNKIHSSKIVPSKYQGILNPRNTKQVENKQMAVKNQGIYVMILFITCQSFFII